MLELFASTLFLKVNGIQKKSITSKSVVGRTGLIYHLPCFSSLTVRPILLFPWKQVWSLSITFIYFFPPKVLAHRASTWKMKPSDFCPYWAFWPRPKIIVCQDHLHLKNAKRLGCHLDLCCCQPCKINVRFHQNLTAEGCAHAWNLPLPPEFSRSVLANKGSFTPHSGALSRLLCPKA